MQVHSYLRIRFGMKPQKILLKISGLYALRHPQEPSIHETATQPVPGGRGLEFLPGGWNFFWGGWSWHLGELSIKNQALCSLSSSMFTDLDPIKLSTQSQD